jgi:uncharacterized protein (DUF433 family)
MLGRNDTLPDSASLLALAGAARQVAVIAHTGSKNEQRPAMVIPPETANMRARRTARPTSRKPKRRIEALGRYVVVDTGICHGQPTFRGTRVLVADVLAQVARGMAWESIVEEWHGSVPPEAIGEAVQLAREALVSTLTGQNRMTGS